MLDACCDTFGLVHAAHDRSLLTAYPRKDTLVRPQGAVRVLKCGCCCCMVCALSFRHGGLSMSCYLAAKMYTGNTPPTWHSTARLPQHNLPWKVVPTRSGHCSITSALWRGQLQDLCAVLLHLTAAAATLARIQGLAQQRMSYSQRVHELGCIWSCQIVLNLICPTAGATRLLF